MVVLAGGTDSDSTSTSRGTGTPPNCGGSNYKYMRQEVQKVEAKTVAPLLVVIQK